ncbi:helix-turn-helix domain-containing protein [Paraflavisolibacter sp. H34]|uniref:helix-turn-helix domain-containing protein n=1 Tax=Huijunlia imazamoxiresistens TaxID=3127457 RepID=UPI0030173C82
MDQPIFEIKPGIIVLFNSERYEVLRLLDASSALARKPHTQEVQRLYIDKLEPIVEGDTKVPQEKIVDLGEVSEKNWEVAKKRFEFVSLFFEGINGNNNTADEIANRAGVHRSTFYRWLKKYQRTGLASSLLNEENNGGRGKKRLSKEVEAVIESVIDDRYLTTQRLSVKKVSFEIAGKCKNAGLPPPDYKTVRNRVYAITEEKRMARRYDKSVANNKYEPVQGSFPGADYPLAVVQIDHTLLDIITVDDASREPIGRPWITIAIDVFSRMVLGFYISLDPPGAMGTGLCLSHAILPKELWLAKINIEGRWPCYGIMKSIYLDNAKEFHGYMLERACQEYGIEINFRPVKKPKYGGHIERLIGTVLNEIHTVKGTTFSNSGQRKFYESEKEACLTIAELEKWLATFIVNVYHERQHKAIGTSPIAKYTEGIVGSKNQIGTGLQRPIVNELKLKLDFMPFIERTIQKSGVQVNLINYYHDILRKWIHACANTDTRASKKRKFIFKMDPRDISVIYFYDPDIKEYFPIPYRNPALPPMTIWEHREIIRSLQKNSKNEVTENAIFEAYSRMKQIEDTASKTTVRARRKNTRALHALQKSIRNEIAPLKPDNIAEDPITGDCILPFEDLEDEPFK